jgi:hypothetical protein
MKTKIGRKVPSLTKDTPKDVESLTITTQTIVDDLTQVISGGLLVNDGNLPFSFYKKNVTSNIPFEVTGFGAIVTTSSSKLTGFKTKQLRANLLRVTMTFEDNRSDVVLMIVQEATK